MMKKMMTIMMVTIALLLATAVPAKENPVGLTPTDEQVKSGVKKPGYSPYAGRHFPRK
jgi:predicted lipoprotein